MSSNIVDRVNHEVRVNLVSQIKCDSYSDIVISLALCRSSQGKRRVSNVFIQQI